MNGTGNTPGTIFPGVFPVPFIAVIASFDRYCAAWSFYSKIGLVPGVFPHHHINRRSGLLGLVLVIRLCPARSAFGFLAALGSLRRRKTRRLHGFNGCGPRRRGCGYIGYVCGGLTGYGYRACRGWSDNSRRDDQFGNTVSIRACPAVVG